MSPTSKISLIQKNLCRDYYHLLIKQKYKKKTNKWAKLREEFNLEDKQLSEAFVMPLTVANEPYVRSFQYKVLNLFYLQMNYFVRQAIFLTPTVPSVIRLMRPYLIFSLTVLFLPPIGMRCVKKFQINLIVAFASLQNIARLFQDF